MKLHRYYVGGDLELRRLIWVNDQHLLHKWALETGLQRDQQIVLFNDLQEERLYVIDRVEPKALHLRMVTEMSPKMPPREVYLCFFPGRKEKTSEILRQGTEFGVRHFVPLEIVGSHQDDFDSKQATEDVIKFSEHASWSEVPKVREPLSLKTALEELSAKTTVYFTTTGGQQTALEATPGVVAVFLEPAGKWQDSQKSLFKEFSGQQVITDSVNPTSFLTNFMSG